MGTPLTLRITRSELARTLALLRVSRGWSQGELAAAAGLSSALVSNAENGEVLPPSTRSLETLVEAMGFPLTILARARDFLRELDSEVRQQDARRESPEWTRELPALAVERQGNEDARRPLPPARSFPGSRTTTYAAPAWARR
jgi:transcriptional regulator with XRE-family HTH domain